MIIEIETHEINEEILMHWCRDLDVLCHTYKLTAVYSDGNYIDIVEIGNNNNFELFTKKEVQE